MITTFAIKKQGEEYLVLEQAGSDYHAEKPVHPAAGRDETEEWLLAQGAAQVDITRAFEEIVSAGRVYIEIDKDYSEAEGFPKQPSGSK